MKESTRKLHPIDAEALAHYAFSELRQPLDASNFLEFAQRLRLFNEIFAYYERKYAEHVVVYKKEHKNKMAAQKMLEEYRERNEHIPDKVLVEAHRPITPYPASNLLWDLERNLFPWIPGKFNSLLDLKQSFKGRGLVIPTGSHHLRFTIHLIRHLRLLGFSYPIMVAYAGEGDLKENELDFLHRMGTETMDVTKIINGTGMGLNGWQIKPFALLAAPFEEVIMADGDIVFLQNPEFMFEDLGYKKHGTILFHDRTLFEGDKNKRKWLETHLPQPLSESVKSTRMHQMKSGHELESGVILWNKKTHIAGLLAACKMNGFDERKSVTYKEFYGDKESYWIGLGMAGQSWSQLHPTPGVIGDAYYSEKREKLVAKGRILHFDRQGWPFWLNGAIVTNKRNSTGSMTIMNFTHYAREGRWEFSDSSLDKDVTPINSTLMATIDGIAALYVPKIDYDGLAEMDPNWVPLKKLS